MLDNPLTPAQLPRERWWLAFGGVLALSVMLLWGNHERLQRRAAAQQKLERRLEMWFANKAICALDVTVPEWPTLIRCDEGCRPAEQIFVRNIMIQGDRR
jgi:hypothetical protein